MLTASVIKIKKNILPNITFILKIFSENGIILSEWPYFLRSKSNVDFKETCFFLNRGFVHTRKHAQCITSQVPII